LARVYQKTSRIKDKVKDEEVFWVFLLRMISRWSLSLFSLLFIAPSAEEIIHMNKKHVPFSLFTQ